MSSDADRTSPDAQDDEPFLVSSARGGHEGAAPASAAALGDLPPIRGLDQRMPFEFDDATALLDSMRAGQRTASGLLEEHLGRLTREQSRLNGASQVRAERALAQAATPTPGPLGGLPISVKEQIGLGGEQITTGSRRMAPLECPRDAAVVTRLKDAGAIVLARGNVPELGLAAETDNPRYGRSNNPLDPARTCGGSSGGDAALVASGCVAAALGSDMLGSIRIPAAFCGVVGYKPTSGAVDKRGAWPDAAGALDGWHCIGPITRSVRDARLISEVISGPLPLPPLLEEVEFVVPDGLPVEIKDPAISSAWKRAARALELAGMRRSNIDFNDIEGLARDVSAVAAAELLPLLEALLRDERGQRFSTLQETWNRVRGRASVSNAVYQIMSTLPLLKPRGAARRQALLKRYEQARDRYANLLGPHRLILMPTLGVLAPYHGQMNKAALRPGLNRTLTPLPLCNYLDLAALCLPAWSDRDVRTGLPPSITLAGVAGSEPALFAAATALEQVLAIPGQADMTGTEPRLTRSVPPPTP